MIRLITTALDALAKLIGRASSDDPEPKKIRRIKPIREAVADSDAKDDARLDDLRDKRGDT